MSDLIVLAFKDHQGAFQLRDKLISLQKQHIVTLEDAAVVVRHDDGKVKVKQVTSLTGAGALGGAFWGMLIGLLFWMPWLGLAIGAVTGALAGKFSDIGVDDAFIKEVGTTIEPGHSALFLLVREATTDKLMDQIKDFDATVLQTSLSREEEDKLRDLFSGDDEIEMATETI
jgi:uncharacterized membrane protein